MRQTVASLRAEISSFSLTSHHNQLDQSPSYDQHQPLSTQQRLDNQPRRGLTEDLPIDLTGDSPGYLTGDLTGEIDTLRGKLRRADKHYVVMCRTIEQLETEIKTQVMMITIIHCSHHSFDPVLFPLNLKITLTLTVLNPNPDQSCLLMCCAVLCCTIPLCCSVSGGPVRTVSRHGRNKD